MSNGTIFEETPAYVELTEKFNREHRALVLLMESKLAERGRKVAKFPDDSDLVDWYNEEMRDLMIWLERDREDMKREFFKLR